MNTRFLYSLRAFASRALQAVASILVAVALMAGLAAEGRSATVDIMYVYDTGATAWVASNGGMTVFSQQITQRINQAMQNSGVDLTLRFVHAMPVEYTTASLNNADALTDLQSGTGPFVVVHEARNTYGADLVAMLSDPASSSSTAGWAYTLSSWSGRPTYAFSVNNIRFANTHYTLTHELGHNFGAHHAKAQASYPGPNTSLKNPSAPYSAGWYFTGTNQVSYNTIMAYYYDGYGNTYQQAPVFSSPLITWQGAAAGDAADGDNARLLRETMGTIAGYRAAVAFRTLTVDATGAEGVVIDSPDEGFGGTAPYSVGGILPGTTVTLTAPSEADGAVFDSWSGCDSVDGTECTVTLDADRTVQAAYASITRTLSVEVQGVPAVLVDSEPSGYGGTAPYAVADISQGSVITLTAPPSVDGVPFLGWTGCDATLNATCSLEMDTDKTATAVYGSTGGPASLPGVLMLLLGE